MFWEFSSSFVKTERERERERGGEKKIQNKLQSRHVMVEEPLPVIRLDDALINFMSDLLKQARREHIMIALLI